MTVDTRPLVAIVKTNGLGQIHADRFNDMCRDINFTHASSAEDAIAMNEATPLALIVSGLHRIDWEALIEKFGPENVIVFSAFDDQKDEVESKGAMFLEVGKSEEELIKAVRSKIGNRS